MKVTLIKILKEKRLCKKWNLNSSNRLEAKEWLFKINIPISNNYSQVNCIFFTNYRELEKIN